MNTLASRRFRAVVAAVAGLAVVLAACGDADEEVVEPPEAEQPEPAQPEPEPPEPDEDPVADGEQPFEVAVTFGDFEFQFTTLAVADDQLFVRFNLLNPTSDGSVYVTTDDFRLIAADGLPSAPVAGGLVGSSRVDAGAAERYELRFALPPNGIDGSTLRIGRQDVEPLLIGLPGGEVEESPYPMSFTVGIEDEFMISRSAREATLAFEVTWVRLQLDRGPERRLGLGGGYLSDRRVSQGNVYLVVELEVENLGGATRSPTWSPVYPGDSDFALEVPGERLLFSPEAFRQPSSSIDLDEHQEWAVYFEIPADAAGMVLLVGDSDPRVRIPLEVGELSEGRVRQHIGEISGDVLFATGASTLLPAADAELARIQSQIEAAMSDPLVVIVGHTDSRGSAQDNMQLSLDRANAVRQWFVDNGFPADRIVAEGRGAEEPAVDDMPDGNFDEEAGAVNRRVEIVVEQDR